MAAGAAAADPAFSLFRDQTRFWIQRVAVPLLMVIGVFGNLITVIIMTRRRMRSTTNMYLAALALVDMFYLVLTFLLGLSHYPNMAQPRYQLYWHLRPFLMMLTDACSNTSVWLTVTFTIERYIAVRYPMKGKVWCTEARARMLITCVFVFGILFAAPVPFEWKVIEKKLPPPANRVPMAAVATTTIMTGDTRNGNNKNHNGPLLAATGSSADVQQDSNYANRDSYALTLDYSDFGRNETYKTIYYWSTAVIFYFVPLFSLTLFNGYLIKSVHQSKRERNKLTVGQTGATSSVASGHQQQRQLQQQQQLPPKPNNKPILSKANEIVAAAAASRKAIELTTTTSVALSTTMTATTTTTATVLTTSLLDQSSKLKWAQEAAEALEELSDQNVTSQLASEADSGQPFEALIGQSENSNSKSQTLECLVGSEKENERDEEKEDDEADGADDENSPIRANGAATILVNSNYDSAAIHTDSNSSPNTCSIQSLVKKQPAAAAPKTRSSIRLTLRSKRNHNDADLSQSTPSASSVQQQQLNHSPSSSQERRITIMLIAVVILFLFCQIPSAAMLLYTSVRELEPNTNEHALVLAFGNIFNFLMAVNAAGNFILYSFLSKKYRKTFVILFCYCLKPAVSSVDIRQQQQQNGFKYASVRNTVHPNSLFDTRKPSERSSRLDTPV